MLNDVSLSLQNFFKGQYKKIFGEIPPYGLKETPDFVIGSFNDENKPNRNSISLFLFDIAEDCDLRSNEPVTRFDFDSMQEISNPPPKRITLSYLVTGWCGKDQDKETLQAKQLAEQAILGTALYIAVSSPSIPKEYAADPNLANYENLPMLALQKENNSQIKDLWSQFKCIPKAYFTLSVTTYVFPYTLPEKSHLVTKISADFSAGSKVGVDSTASLGGLVSDDNDLPIGQASVIIEETGQVVLSQVNGYFILSGIRPGRYTVKAYANGFKPARLENVDFGSTGNKLFIKLIKH